MPALPQRSTQTPSDQRPSFRLVQPDASETHQACETHQAGQPAAAIPPNGEQSRSSERKGYASDHPYRTWVGISMAIIAGTGLSMLSGCQWAAGSQNATGTALYQQGQYNAAMEQFQKAIASSPTDPDGYYNLAATTHRLGNQRQDPNLIRQSEALYNQCLDHDPNHVDCHRGLAVLLVDSGRPDRAFTLLKNWAAQNPTYSEPRIELARLYEEHGEPQTALKYLEDAVQQDSNNARAWLALARLRENGNDPVQALQNYQRALALGGAGNQALVSERIAAISRQLNSVRDANLNRGGTQLAAPPVYGGTRY